jgi:hypothetical protein
MFVKINGTNLVRDTNSMGISNQDSAAKEEYYAKVRMIQNQKEGLNKVNEEINELRCELGDIKCLLVKLLNKQ